MRNSPGLRRREKEVQPQHWAHSGSLHARLVETQPRFPLRARQNAYADFGPVYTTSSRMRSGVPNTTW